MSEEFSETDQIEQDLAQARARMDDRLDELQNKMSPAQLLNDMFSYFRGGNGADFTNDLIMRAKANPMPVALTGVGLTWLMVSKNKTLSAPRKADDLEARIRSAEGLVHRYDDEHEEAHDSRLDDARGKVMGVARAQSDTGPSYKQRIQEALTSAMHKAREATHDAQAAATETLANLGGRARSRPAPLNKENQTMARSVRDTVSAMTANPLALGAVAALVGLVAGSLIPTLDEEEQMLGATAGKLRSAGHDIAQSVVDGGGKVAADTFDAIKGSAEDVGLTSHKSVGELYHGIKSGDLADQVGQVARDTLKAGQASLQTHIGDVQAKPDNEV